MYEVASINPGETTTFEIWYENQASYDMECSVWCDRHPLEGSSRTRDFLLSLMFGPRRFRSLELSSSDDEVLDVISSNVYRFRYDFADEDCSGDDESCHEKRRIRWFGQEPCAFRFICPKVCVNITGATIMEQK